MKDSKTIDRPIPPGAASLVFTHRDTGANFDVYNSDRPLSDAFVDGIAQIGIGPIFTKLTFFSSLGSYEEEPGSSVEERILTQRVTIPTAALAEFSIQFLKSLEANATMLEGVALQNVEKLKAFTKVLK